MFGLLQQNPIRLYRPTASVGTITNAALAYDVDAAPWATRAQRAEVAGSAVSGTPDTVSVTYNGFSAIAKTAFVTCNLQIVLDWFGRTLVSSSGTPPAGYYLPSNLGVQVLYRADGGTYIPIATYSPTTYLILPPGGTPNESYFGGKVVISQAIPSSAFTANLSNLDIRFDMTTFTYTALPYSFVTISSYNVWDIQTNLT